MKKFLLALFLLLVEAVLFYCLGLKKGEEGHTEVVREKVDTITIERLIDVPTPILIGDIVLDTAYFPVHDTVRVRDTLFLPISRVQREYAGDSYRAWVSGVDPKLDSLRFFVEQPIITRTIETERKKSRFGLSVAVGPAIIYTPFHNSRIDAGVGATVGVSYTF